MNINKSAVGWRFSRVKKIFGNLLSLILRCVLPVKKGRVVCWSFDFKQYSCSPRYLTEYILDNNPEFEVYWVFRHSLDVSSIDKRVKYVRRRTWKYFILLNTAEFLISNVRTDPWKIYWNKRPGQKYLMLWHGSIALKKIEADAEHLLSYSYIKKAKLDSKVCDLMISGCRMQTELLKNKFWYNGEVLEKGIPRNDIFFQKAKHSQIRERICAQYGINPNDRIVLYAPTFRRGHSLDSYKINWKGIIPHLADFLDGSVSLLIRLHPHLINKDTSSLINDSCIIDVTKYHDMQELLCASDMLITDYSSSMFEFSMQMRPCLLYATDVEQYDRGYYFDFNELPYPLARTEDELIEIIKNLDLVKYKQKLQQFFTEKVGLIENGNACKELTEWMIRHSIK